MLHAAGRFARQSALARDAAPHALSTPRTRGNGNTGGVAGLQTRADAGLQLWTYGEGGAAVCCRGALSRASNFGQ
jgi:hypothetical protein